MTPEVDHKLLSPVRRSDGEVDAPQPGVGLCLSGGGFRAMLFHAGSLWRLNEAGMLGRIGRISSVSGGSIVAAVLATRWTKLGFGADGVAGAFVDELVAPVRRLAGKTIDVPAVLTGLLLPGVTINQRLARAYRRNLFRSMTLADLPDEPEFVLNATSLQTGDLWRFSKSHQGDWRVGMAAGASTQVAAAVAASSAFPPVLSPSVFSLAAGLVAGGGDPAVAVAPYTTRPVLADGGVYDNLGLETVWKEFDTVLVSDGGGHMADAPSPRRLWVLQFMRVLTVIDNQVRDLRKRQAVSSYVSGVRKGAYWGIRSHVRDFGLPDPLLDPTDEQVKRLSGISTRLAKLDSERQQALINWGYLICDTALRRHIDPSQPRGSLPYPKTGMG